MKTIEKIIYFIGGTWLLDRLNWIIGTDAQYFSDHWQNDNNKEQTHE